MRFVPSILPSIHCTEILLTILSCCVLRLSSSLDSVLESYDLKDKGFNIEDFLQVDKQGLVMDDIGALQVHVMRFSVDDPETNKAGDNLDTVANAAATATKVTTTTAADLTIQSDSTDKEYGANSGSADEVSGGIMLTTGSTDHRPPEPITLQGGKSEYAKGGSTLVAGGDSSFQEGGDTVLRGGESLRGIGGSIDLSAGSGAFGGGSIDIAGGGSSESGQGGAISILSGISSTNDASGSLSIATADTIRYDPYSSASSGSITIRTGETGAEMNGGG